MSKQTKSKSEKEKSKKIKVEEEKTEEKINIHAFKVSFSIKLMIFLWILLLVSIFWGLYRVLSEQKHIDTGLNTYITQAYPLIYQDNPTSLQLAEQKLLKAQKFKQRDLRIWAGLSLITARLSLEYNISPLKWKTYHATGKSLLVQEGFEKIMTVNIEPYWLESELTYKYVTAKTKKDKLAVFFNVQKAWGIYPKHPGIVALYSRLLFEIGKTKQSFKLLTELKSPITLSTLLILNLETNNLKAAEKIIVELKKINPSHPYIPLSETYISYKKTGKLKKINIDPKYKNLPNISAWSKLNNFFADPAKVNISKANINTNLSFIAKSLIYYQLSLGRYNEALNILNKTFKGYFENNTILKQLKAKILIASGHPKRALQLVKNPTNQEELIIKLQSLWFSNQYKKAEELSLKLNPNNKWKILFSKKIPATFSDKNILIAHLTNIKSDNPLKKIEKLKSLITNYEFSFYAKLSIMKYYMIAALKSGIGTKQASEYLKQVKQYIISDSDSIYMDRLKAQFAFYQGKYGEALVLARKICNRSVNAKQTSLVCGSPEVNLNDKIFLLKLLTLYYSSDTDPEIAVSQAIKLIKNNIKNKVDKFYWNTKLALLKIRLMPSRLSYIVKTIFSNYERLKKDLKNNDKLIKIEEALIPLFILSSKTHLMLEALNKSNKPLVWVETLKILSETGNRVETLKLANRINKKFENLNDQLKKELNTILTKNFSSKKKH